MNKKIIIPVLVVVLVAIVGTYLTQKTDDKVVSDQSSTEKNKIPAFESEAVSPVKEFSMTSFVNVVDGKYFPQYSLKEITVNKGDRVKIKITVTSGMHDFKIDEYGIYADTQLNKEYVIEFVADKAGKFEYYCTKPGHRKNGQFGTLTVLDIQK